MRQASVGLLSGFAILGVLATGLAATQECSGAITAAEAAKAEDARYAAQTANDFAAMEKSSAPSSRTSTPPPPSTGRRAISTP